MNRYFENQASTYKSDTSGRDDRYHQNNSGRYPESQQHDSNQVRGVDNERYQGNSREGAFRSSTNYRNSSSFSSGNYGSANNYRENNTSTPSSWKSSSSASGGSGFDNGRQGNSSFSGNNYNSIALGLDPKDMPPISKSFYKEDPAVSAMSHGEVEEFRRKNEMSIQGREVPRPITTFVQAGFPQVVLSRMEEDKYTVPTPIQAQGWPMALIGRNMVGIAQTGSGKTLSYVLPGLLHITHQIPNMKNNDHRERRASPKALVLAPTRELAMQIHEVARKYGNIMRIKSVCVFGGGPRKPQQYALQGGCDLLIATPGRLIDFVNDNVVSLDQISYLVLDEADRMLDMGFEPQLRQFLPMIRSDRQVLMWSATWPKGVQKLAHDLLGRDFIQVTIGDTELTANKKIKQVIKILDSNSAKEGCLADLLQSIWNDIPSVNGGPEKQMVRTIIFCNTKRACDQLAWTMREHGWPAVAMHGDMQQSERENVLRDFRSGRRPIFVCTDVAARGLDVKDIRAVVNFDFPKHFEDYVHRIGRTARGMDAEGDAYSFFVPSEDKGIARDLVKLLYESKQPVPPELEALVPRRPDSRSGGFSRYGRAGGPAGRPRFGSGPNNRRPFESGQSNYGNKRF